MASFFLKHAFIIVHIVWWFAELHVIAQNQRLESGGQVGSISFLADVAFTTRQPVLNDIFSINGFLMKDQFHLICFFSLKLKKKRERGRRKINLNAKKSYTAQQSWEWGEGAGFSLKKQTQGLNYCYICASSETTNMQLFQALECM